MASLTDFIQVIPPDDNEEPEDIFASAPGFLYPDDTRNQHGDPGSTIVYKSPRFGNVELKTADPAGEGERQLFSHYLWNAGIKMANLISDPDEPHWAVHDESVLELGAGVGLVGIIATLAGAKEVVLSDYPAPVVLENLSRNIEAAIPNLTDHYCQVVSHEWGELDTSFSDKYKHYFSVVLAADCFWMPHQHSNLLRSMVHFLTTDPGGRIFVTSGFHTGHANLAKFFDAMEETVLMVEQIYEEDTAGLREEWSKERDGSQEDATGRKRWLLIARLKRR